jgi:hypothetical protein
LATGKEIQMPHSKRYSERRSNDADTLAAIGPWWEAWTGETVQGARYFIEAITPSKTVGEAVARAEALRLRGWSSCRRHIRWAFVSGILAINGRRFVPAEEQR